VFYVLYDLCIRISMWHNKLNNNNSNKQVNKINKYVYSTDHQTNDKMMKSLFKDQSINQSINR